MRIIRRTLMLMGTGTVLGFMLWGLAAWDGMPPVGWIIAGLVIVLSLWAGWAIAAKKEQPASVSKAPLTVATPQSNTPNLHRLRLELRSHGLIAFAVSSYSMIGLSRPEVESPHSFDYVPDFLTKVDLAEPLMWALTIGFLLVAVVMLTGSLFGHLAKWFQDHPGAYNWMELLSGAITWTGFTLGWLGSMPTAIQQGPVIGYAYFFGGLVLWILIWLSVVWELRRLGSDLKKASAESASHPETPSAETSDPA